VPTLAIHRDNVLAREIDLKDGTLRIGRGEQNDIVLLDDKKEVSRFHAELRPEDGRYVLYDLNSQNGIRIGGRAQPTITLEPGTPVTVGPYTLTLVAPASFAAETLVLSTDAKTTLRGTKAVLPAPADSTTAPRLAPAKPPAAKPSLRTNTITLAGWTVSKPMLYGGAAMVVALIALSVTFLPASRRGSRQVEPIANPSPAPAAKPEDAKQKGLAEARSLLERNDYDGALKVLEPLLMSDPADVEALDLRTRATTGAKAALAPPVEVAKVDGKPTGAGNGTPPGDRLPTPKKTPEGLPPIEIGCRPGEKRADCAERAREVSDRYDRAKTTLDAGAYEAAIAQFTEITNDEPDYRDVAALLARAREGIHAIAQQALEAAMKAEAEGDLVGAIQQYARARQVDSSTGGVADESSKRVRARMKVEGTDAFKRAKQYDAGDRVPQAVMFYELAFRYLPDDDPNKKVAKDRWDALRARQ